MFGIRAIMAMSSVREACIVERFDYAGNLLCEFECRGVPQTILELEDGGFVVFGTSEPDGLYAFNCYDASGDLRWKYTPAEDGSKSVLHMYQKNGDIYGFGELDPEGEPDDIYIWRISREGELIQALKIGGSDFDSIRRVLETENGFEIFGSTQSGDGDLPFSKNGHGVDFRLEISPELQVLSKEQFENNYASQIGYHHGQPVFEDSPMLNITEKDRIPEGMGRYVRGIFDWEDGYAIIEVTVPQKWDGRKIGDLDVRKKFGINILGVKNGTMDMNITKDTVLYYGHTMLVLGRYEDIRKNFNL
jgi:hypothetical protein